jgi:hypothetical protein
MTDAEKIELAELLAYRSQSPYEIRRNRLRAAEERLGWWSKDGRFLPDGLCEIVEAARLKRRALTRDEFIVTNAGLRGSEEA